jgi:NAD(P)-dependent dehydrogenase (short-subunit alcohol dehydrogenase family)
MKKSIVVLGCNGCLGQAITKKLSTQYSIIGVDKHDKPNLEAVHYYQCDFSVHKNISELVKKLALLDTSYFVSSIGIFGESEFSCNAFPTQQFYSQIQVNLIGIAHFFSELLICKMTLSKLRICIIGSAAGFVGSRNIAYGVSKAGLNGLVRSLSKSFSEKGLVIFGINPGIFLSEMSTSVSTERQEKAIRDTHIKKPSTVNEIAEFCTKILLDKTSFITGSIININGGQYS